MQGTDWTRKFDSTPPTPTTRVFPAAESVARECEGGRMGGSEGGLQEIERYK